MSEREGRSALSVGYCTVDVIHSSGTISHRAGGTACNVAANLAYLGWKASVVARLGRDAAGRRLRGDLQLGGVDVSLMEDDANVESPVIVQEVTSPRHRFLFRCPSCGRRFPRYRPISRPHLASLFDRLPFADVFFMDRASSSALSLAAELRRRGALIVFEPSSPGVAKRTLAAAEAAHVLKCSHERQARITPELMAPRAGQLQIETLGDRGLRFRQGLGDWETLVPPVVSVVDSAGAGDWLTAAFLSEFVAPGPGAVPRPEVREALTQAQGLAALSCCFVGARTMAKLPRKNVLLAARDLLAGKELHLDSVAEDPSIRTRGGCVMCLGPRSNGKP